MSRSIGSIRVAMALGAMLLSVSSLAYTQERKTRPLQSFRIPPGAVGGQPAANGNQPQIFVAERLTRAQFSALPDNAVLQLRDRRITVGEVRAGFRQQAEAARAAAPQQRIASENEFRRRRQEFLSRRKADLDAKNARVRAEITRRFVSSPGGMH